jgi:hypothetical protein
MRGILFSYEFPSNCVKSYLSALCRSSLVYWIGWVFDQTFDDLVPGGI